MQRSAHHQAPASGEGGQAPAQSETFDVTGWLHDLGDEKMLARLLALNLERAG